MMYPICITFIHFPFIFSIIIYVRLCVHTLSKFDFRENPTSGDFGTIKTLQGRNDNFVSILKEIDLLNSVGSPYYYIRPCTWSKNIPSGLIQIL